MTCYIIFTLIKQRFTVLATSNRHTSSYNPMKLEKQTNTIDSTTKSIITMKIPFETNFSKKLLKGTMYHYEITNKRFLVFFVT